MADLLGQLEASFNHRKVSICEFAESKEFCGRMLYPRQRLLLKLFFLEELTDTEERILDYWIKGGSTTRYGPEMTVSPYIRERIQYLRDQGYKHFREIVLVGGRRCSKGFITGLSVAKKMYDTMQLQDPGRYYGIDTDKEIVFAAVAASQQQAQEMQYADMSAMVNSCMAMQKYINKMQELEFSVYTEGDLRQLASWKAQRRKVMKDTAKLRGRALPANARTIRGMAAMALVFDEFAHFQQGESDQADSEVYAAATPALAQFGPDGMIFCNSSPYSKVGTFFERYELAMATDDGEPASPTSLAIRLPSWALYDGWWEDPLYIGQKKSLMVNPDWEIERRKPDSDDYFYASDDRKLILQQRWEERDDPTKYKVEIRGHFAEVIDAYLNPEMVDRMFQGRPYWNEEEKRFDYRAMETNLVDGTYQYKYYAHIDPSSTTAGFGFALGHVEVFEVDGVPEQHVVYDIIQRWNPKDFDDDVIAWEPILEELVRLCRIFRPQQLTFDQHQNQWPMQWLRKTLRSQGCGEVRVFEKTANVKLNWNRAEVFRTALYRGWVHAPFDTADCHYASQELKYLQEIKSGQVPRVEKQDVGPVQTKDMADCMMEVVEACIGNLIATGDREALGEMGLAVGAPGGYPLGGWGEGRSARSAELAAYYSRRHGDQSFGGGRPRPTPVSPSRRPIGGRPIHRRLPGR